MIDVFVIINEVLYIIMNKLRNLKEVVVVVVILCKVNKVVNNVVVGFRFRSGFRFRFRFK